MMISARQDKLSFLFFFFAMRHDISLFLPLFIFRLLI